MVRYALPSSKSTQRQSAGRYMMEHSHAKGFIDSAAAAAYIAELSSDLAQIARRHGLDALGFILDMARLEAEALSRLQQRGRSD
jgi:hypothetical protein